MNRPLTPSQAFAQRLDLLDAAQLQPPETTAEAERILAKAGIDPRAFVRTARAHVRKVRGELYTAQLAHAAEERLREQRRLEHSGSTLSGLTLDELKRRVRALLDSPAGSHLAVSHKGLSGPATREELEALLVESEYLDGDLDGSSD